MNISSKMMHEFNYGRDTGRIRHGFLSDETGPISLDGLVD